MKRLYLLSFIIPVLLMSVGNGMTWKKSTGTGGNPVNTRSVFALETQHFPDSPNHQDFPSTILSPGEKFRSRTIYRFSVKMDK